MVKAVCRMIAEVGAESGLVRALLAAVHMPDMEMLIEGAWVWSRVVVWWQAGTYRMMACHRASRGPAMRIASGSKLRVT